MPNSDPARDLGDDRIVLGLAGFEQLGHPRQTAGDVASLGGFAAARASTSPASTTSGRPRPTAVHARRQHVTAASPAIVQRVMRGRRSSFFDGRHGYSVTTRWAMPVASSVCSDSVLPRRSGPGTSRYAALFGDHRHGERIPFGDPIALGFTIWPSFVPAGARHRACGASRVRGRPCPRIATSPLRTRRPSGGRGLVLRIVGRSRNSTVPSLPPLPGSTVR